MKDGPAFAPIGFLAGDPARANMLAALLGGQALTAAELAREAGITPSTASVHLAKLESGALIERVRQGRHCYFRLAGSDVGELLEKMTEVAARVGHWRTRPGPSDVRMRKARICYDHLAGEMGVDLLAGLLERAYLSAEGDSIAVTQSGEAFLTEFGIELGALARNRRPICKTCLDWSQRRSHLAGSLGAALLRRMRELRWARPDKSSRAIAFTPAGEASFRRAFAKVK